MQALAAPGDAAARAEAALNPPPTANLPAANPPGANPPGTPQLPGAAPQAPIPPRLPGDAARPPDGAGPAASDAAPAGPGEAAQASPVPGDPQAILLPFAPGVGAASFPYAGLAHAVFDDSKAIDLSALASDPVFGAARITLSPRATHVSVPLGPGARLALRRVPEGWILRVTHDHPDEASAHASLRGGALLLTNPAASDTVVIPDAVTGGQLFVGTVRRHAAPVYVGMTAPQYAVLPSWEGVAVSPQSDRLTLATAREGFVLRAGPGESLAAAISDAVQAAMEKAGPLTRRFGLPVLSTPDLRAQMQADIAAAAAAPRGGRFAPRLRAAQDMLALGLGREAASLLDIARQDDPAQAGNALAGAMQAMSAMLDGQPAGAEGFANPALGDADEVALWRALASPQAPGSAATAADTWPLLLGYAAPLRERLLPAAAALLIRGGERGAAGALIAAADTDGALEGAHAALLRAQGKPAEALAVLDRLASLRDRKQAAEARAEAIELRLSSRALSPAAAAKSILRNLYSWREEDFELRQRLRAAGLMTEAGAFRPALALLRETDSLFPAAHDRVRAAEASVIRALLAAGSGSALTPLDLVALVEENTDLLGDDAALASVTPVLLDKLVALDLPDRAELCIRKLIASAQDDGARASLGARLASLLLERGDLSGGLRALDDTEANGIAAPLADQRRVLRARALAQSGREEEASRLLDTIGGTDAAELRAQLAEHRHDWRAAEDALQVLAKSIVPTMGSLNEAQQDLVLRLAADASQAGDSGALAALKTGAASRMPPGPRARLLSTLTAEPVQGVADLPRSAREAEEARALPAALASFQPR